MSLCRKLASINASSLGSIWHEIIRNVSMVLLEFDLGGVDYLYKVKMDSYGMIGFLVCRINCFTQMALDIQSGCDVIYNMMESNDAGFLFKWCSAKYLLHGSIDEMLLVMGFDEPLQKMRHQ